MGARTAQGRTRPCHLPSCSAITDPQLPVGSLGCISSDPAERKSDWLSPTSGSNQLCPEHRSLGPATAPQGPGGGPWAGHAHYRGGRVHKGFGQLDPFSPLLGVPWSLRTRGTRGRAEKQYLCCLLSVPLTQTPVWRQWGLGDGVRSPALGWPQKSWAAGPPLSVSK